MSTPQPTVVLSRVTQYLLLFAWLIFGLGGWAIMGTVYYHTDFDRPIMNIPLVLEGCKSVQYLDPPPT